MHRKWWRKAFVHRHRGWGHESVELHRVTLRQKSIRESLELRPLAGASNPQEKGKLVSWPSARTQGQVVILSVQVDDKTEKRWITQRKDLSTPSLQQWHTSSASPILQQDRETLFPHQLQHNPSQQARREEIEIPGQQAHGLKILI